MDQTVLVILTVLAVVVAVLWIFLPFAIFGTKDLLREIRDELRSLNTHLAFRQPRASDGHLPVPGVKDPHSSE